MALERKGNSWLWLVAPALLLPSGTVQAQDAAVRDTAAVDAVAPTDTLEPEPRPRAPDADAERLPLLELTPDGDAVARWRLQQLTGASTAGFLLRSTSTMLEQYRAVAGARFFVIKPSTRVSFSSGFPLAANDGPMQPGKGANVITTLGFRYAHGPLRIVFAPQLVYATNRESGARDSTVFWSPAPDSGRIGRAYAFTWYKGQFSIDLPVRFGDGAVGRFDPGQSSAYVQVGALDIGVGTENNWWGPGVRNALVLSNAAPGFTHLFLRSGRPWYTRVGMVEARWLVGGLAESDYFDTDPDNDLRSLSAIAVALQPWFSSNLTLGGARTVMGNASGWGAVLGRWFDVVRRTGRVEEQLAWDAPATTGGREHIVALFARYVMPNAGAELYGEWGRTALSSMRDLFIAPNHTQGYTVGLQWSRLVGTAGSRLQVQTEVTTVEQSATFRDRPLGTWYASRRVVQGYTHRGEMLGAAIGPGASSQWLAVDYFARRGALGGYFGRIRWNEDIRSGFPWPDYLAYCNHDVQLYGGIRGERRAAFGLLAFDVSHSNRINAFFQRAGCFGPNYRDIRNTSLKLTYAPSW